MVTPPVRFTILGPVRARHGAADLDLGGRQQRLVLALLLARTRAVVTVSELVDAVWDDDPPSSAVNVVHRYIGTLRRLIEPGLPVRATGDHLIRHAAGYQLRVDEDALDLLVFRRLARQARRAQESGDTARAVEHYTEALALWRGPCAAGLEPVSSVHPTFVAIAAEHTQVLRDAADVALRHGLPRAVIPALRQAVGWSPLDEPLQARLITALAADGLQAEAVEVYHEVRRRLGTDLGIAPGAELAGAYERVLRQNGTTAPAAPVTLPRVDAGPPVPAQLPPDHPFFTGRDDVLARAEAVIAEDHALGRPVVTLAVDGMPGVGKTTFSVRLAHRLTAGYPGGQLFADLRGFAADGPAMRPEEALRGFLGALGVPADRMPGELHALAGLYRSIVSDRRVLVVLDNAKDYEQVRHLLPSGARSLAVVTSRVRITSLISAAGAHPLPLDTPPDHEARQILVRRLGAGRVDAEPAAADRIVTRCGRLPLALTLVAARLAARPEATLAGAAAELATAGAGLDGFGTDLTAVFSWSYQALSTGAARLLRLLAAHPGPDVSAAAAARLAGVDPRAGRVLLGELVTFMLVQERLGRYRTHALVRAYAEDLSRRQDDPAAVREALDRVFAYYRVGAYTAQRELGPGLAPPRPAGEPVAPVTGRHEAMGWFNAEHRVLTAVAGRAAELGDHATTWHVALNMQDFLHGTGRITQWAAIIRQGLSAAEAAGERTARAYLHRSLAGALFMAGDLTAAAGQLSRAETLLDPERDRHALAVVQLNWAYLRAQENRHADAVAHGEKALATLWTGDDERARAQALRAVAGSLAALGQHQDALELLRETLALSWASDDTAGAGYSWDLLGLAHHRMGLIGEAIEHWEQAAQAYRRAGIPAALADVLLSLGDAYHDATDDNAARDRWDQALAVLPDRAGPLAIELLERSASGPRT